MQHQQPYTVSFLRWACDYIDGRQTGEAYKKSSLQGILVTFESTRSKKTAFKTRTNWDEPASTQFTLEPGTKMVDFWLCMDYALVGAICRENSFEEVASDQDLYSWFESLPTPDKFEDRGLYSPYFRMLKEKFPEVEFKLVNNGFSTHWDFNG